MKSFLALLTAAASANAYFLFAHSNDLVTQRLDPIVSPGNVSSHVHTILGGSGFGPTLSTAQLRASKCTTVPIQEDKSNYWVPHMFFQWKNGSVSSLTGGMVTYYLFSDKPGTTTAFPDDFRMISGDPTLRSYNPSSFAQQAVTFLCLDFNGVSKTYNQLPRGTSCPSGIRSQINFPSCWDGKNVDSPDHKSHVAFLSDGPDKGSCKDPKYPVTLPRIFLEFYWDAQDWEVHRKDALDPEQPFVFSNGDATGYGYHADFFNGWQKGVLQKVVDNCHCNDFGDATCCAQQGLFTLNKSPPQCTIESVVNEPVLGTLAKLPGNNPITGGVVAQPGGANNAPPSAPPGTKNIPPATTTGSAPAATATPGSPSNSGSGSSNQGSSSNSGSSNSGSSNSGNSGSSSSGNGSPNGGSSNSGSNSGSGSSGSNSGSGSSSSNSGTNPGSSSSGSSSTGSSPSNSNGSGQSSVSQPAPGSSGSGSSSSKPPKCKQRKVKRAQGVLERAAEPEPVTNDSHIVKFKASAHKQSFNRRWGRTMGSIH